MAASVTLLMTATISPPPDATFLSRREPSLRLDDYIAALKYYLDLPDNVVDRILFVDNSASDVTRLRETAAQHGRNKRVEVMTFDGNNHPGSYGKAFGEFKLLDHAISTSQLVGKDSLIWKVTGRLKCLNLANLIRTAPPAYDLYGDFKRFRTKWFDLRLYSFTLNGYDKLFRGRFPEFREDLLPVPPEAFLFDDLLSRRQLCRIVPRFRQQPHLQGLSGQFNTALDSPRERRRARVKGLLRQLVPALWV